MKTPSQFTYAEGDLRIHSLLFPDGSRWDSINGWNSTP